MLQISPTYASQHHCSALCVPLRDSTSSASKVMTAPGPAPYCSQAGPRLSHIAAGWTNHVLAACGDAVLAALVRLAANREQAAIAQQDLRAPTRAVRRTSLLTSQTPQGLPTEPAVRQVPAICHQRQHALSDLSVTQPLLQQTGTFGCAQ